MSFNNKVPKKEKHKTVKLTYHHVHSNSEKTWNENYLQYICIDPAVDNYAFRIERRYFSGKIEMISFWKSCLLDDGDDNVLKYNNLTQLLDNEKIHFKDTHIVIVEHQLPESYNSLRISQHTLTYFSLHLKDLPLQPEIIEMNSKLKFSKLGAPKGLTKPYLKKWSVEKGIELLNIRNDTKSIEIINMSNKGDDLTDTILMIEALCVIRNYKLTEPYIEKRKITILKKKDIINNG